MSVRWPKRQGMARTAAENAAALASLSITVAGTSTLAPHSKTTAERVAAPSRGMIEGSSTAPASPSSWSWNCAGLRLPEPSRAAQSSTAPAGAPTQEQENGERGGNSLHGASPRG